MDRPLTRRPLRRLCWLTSSAHLLVVAPQGEGSGCNTAEEKRWHNEQAVLTELECEWIRQYHIQVPHTGPAPLGSGFTTVRAAVVDAACDAAARNHPRRAPCTTPCTRGGTGRSSSSTRSGHGARPHAPPHALP